jgi:6,7-dimethyl-8-ribityllumazine synthase
MVHTGHTTQANVTFGFKNPPHVLIIEARFYEHINDMMLAGVTEALEKAGATYEKMIVPGALEIPSALQFAAQRKNTRPFDAYVAIGCVIRGETTHY